MSAELYRERSALLGHLAALYPSCMAYNDPDEPSWPVLYLDTPRGQCSWHIAPSDLDLFEHVVVVPAADPRARWDGHTTDEKYQRLIRLTRDIDAETRQALS